MDQGTFLNKIDKTESQYGRVHMAKIPVIFKSQTVLSTPSRSNVGIISLFCFMCYRFTSVSQGF